MSCLSFGLKGKARQQEYIKTVTNGRKDLVYY
jgi:hypothetical protein